MLLGALERVSRPYRASVRVSTRTGRSRARSSTARATDSLQSLPITHLQAKLARLAGAAMNGTNIVLPSDVQAELAKYLKLAGSHGHNILVPAGRTGMMVSKEVQDLVRATSG